MKLYYAHDPMCSWCWALRPIWKAVKPRLPENLTLHTLLGGLAPDTVEPMPIEMQNRIQETWRRIQLSNPDIEFNFDFWTQCQPRRSTYISCRAVLAAENQGFSGDAMTLAIQTAYYLNAQNPSDETTLIEIAETCGLDQNQFRCDLNSDATHLELKHQIDLCESLDIYSFPSLAVQSEKGHRPVPLDYTDPDTLLNSIEKAISLS